MLGGATEHLLDLFAAEAGLLLHLGTGVARPRMAHVLAPVDTAVQELVTCVLTSELASGSDLTRHILQLLRAVATDWNTDIAGRARPRMTVDLTVLVLAVFVSLAVAVIAARVR